MKLYPPIAYLIQLGTADQDERKQRRIRIINSLSLTTAVLAFIMGIVFFIMNRKLQILIPAMLESVGFLSIIWLNKMRRPETASMAFMILQAMEFVYFGILFGTAVEAILILLFLVNATYLLYEKGPARTVCLIAIAGGLITTEFFYYAEIIDPISFPHTATFILRWLCILFILTMNTLVISFYKDDRNALMKVLEEQKEELERSNKSRKVFLQETSHEIRNPLNAIFGIVQLMRMDIKKAAEPEVLPELVDNLYVASFNIKDIINNILELSRIEAGHLDEVKRKEIHIRTAIRNTANIYEYVANTKGVHIEQQFDDTLPDHVFTDETKLSQIINNLLTNAIKFTRNNSVITIHTGVKERTWFISITDQGGGIEKDKLEKIFEPFVTEKTSFIEGTGLGLYISKHFVLLLNGNITVECEEHLTTTFTVSFPLSDFKRGSALSATEEPPPLRFDNKIILVVEDDKMSQALLRNYLTSLGVQVITANNGVEGLAAARQQVPDLILLDSHMPKMNGKQTLLQLKEDPSLQHIPVIIASGDAFTEAMDVFMKAGASDYVIKPIVLATLPTILERHLS
ncbi:response regulator [Chitinophaga sp. SYP-B3965]|uniref:ATP-binding response regulator n=1 Tax=Chitinophaga sp. SYP-B3965 TaxID=2663120 RepID=UPI0012998ECD|nr:ATP-binding protein [Chitinophaga sp. SYP-B3965]MRG47905.1 response regulator [Chitinophaga sp. SYP-B3965]